MSPLSFIIVIEMIIALFVALAIRNGNRTLFSVIFAIVIGLSAIGSLVVGVEMLMFSYDYNLSPSLAYFWMVLAAAGFVIVAISHPSSPARKN